jgi:hypothetical protein
MVLLGPTLFAAGCAATFLSFVRGFAWGASSFFRWAVLMIGLLMLAIGGCPWVYTSYLVGGRPGNEGAGMLGTLISIVVGLPGLAITTLGALALRSKNHKKEGVDETDQ